MKTVEFEGSRYQLAAEYIKELNKTRLVSTIDYFHDVLNNRFMPIIKHELIGHKLRAESHVITDMEIEFDSETTAKIYIISDIGKEKIISARFVGDSQSIFYNVIKDAELVVRRITSTMHTIGADILEELTKEFDEYIKKHEHDKKKKPDTNANRAKKMMNKSMNRSIR